MIFPTSNTTAPTTEEAEQIAKIIPTKLALGAPTSNDGKVMVEHLLKTWSDDANVVETALSNISDLCNTRKSMAAKQNQTKVMQYGGLLAIVGSLLKFTQSAAVQAAGLSVMANMAGNPEAQVAIAGLGGMDVVLKAMMNHPTYELVQEYGCGALSTLIFENKANGRYFVVHQGLTRLLEAMKAFPDNAALQGFACEILMYISGFGWRNEIKKAGFWPPVAAALAKHYNVEVVWTSANYLLTWLS